LKSGPLKYSLARAEYLDADKQDNLNKHRSSGCSFKVRTSNANGTSFQDGLTTGYAATSLPGTALCMKTLNVEAEGFLKAF
jgi:hypothetical protein